MNPLHEQFIIEARELVDQATDDLIALDREGSTPERIERVFRAVHTLKGSAGIVELPAMGMMLHAAEDVLAAIQAGQIAADTDLIDQGLACLDQVSRWVDEFEARAALPADAAEDAHAMVQRLRAFLPDTASVPEPGADGAAAARAANALPGWISDLIASRRTQISQALSARPATLFAISYEPHAGCFFNGDDPVGLMRQVPELLAFRIEPREAWGGLADLDPYACNLRLRAIAAAGRNELAGIFRLVPDQVRIVELPAATLRPDSTVPLDRSDLIHSILREQQKVLEASSAKQDLAGRVERPRAAPPMPCAPASGATWRSKSTAPARLPLRRAIRGRCRPRSRRRSRHWPASRSPPSRLALLPGLAAAPDGAAARPALRLLRVDEARIDALVNLAGELIVAKNGLAHLARKADDELKDHDLALAIKREHEAIERLAGDMHAAVLRLRMVPVMHVLRPFPRLVRDMSQRLNKKVRLLMRGEATEADKTIVDRLFEPLLHLVRNALDHGVEAPDERRAAGKPDVASIAIQASRIGERFMVEVVDDGRGIDPASVRRKANERGLTTGDELAALSDEQAIDLISCPAFRPRRRSRTFPGAGLGWMRCV